jgi:hypothetical protein
VEPATPPVLVVPQLNATDYVQLLGDGTSVVLGPTQSLDLSDAATSNTTASLTWLLQRAVSLSDTPTTGALRTNGTLRMGRSVLKGNLVEDTSARVLVRSVGVAALC